MEVVAHESQSAHVLRLARDLLDDLELSRLPGEGIVLKAARLARLVGDARIQEWLGYELRGYPAPLAQYPVAWAYMNATGRVQGAVFHYGPLAQQEANVGILKLKLQALRVPDVSYSVASANPHERVTGGFATINPATAMSQSVTAVIVEANQTADQLSIASAIRSKVLGLIHGWAVPIYHERLFSGLATTIFEAFKVATDASLEQRCGDALGKIPHIYERLGAGDEEAVSHALTTGRRVLDSAADALYPPTEAISRDGETIELTARHTKNRLREYIRDRVRSEARRRRLGQTLSNLNDRFSAGVHDVVTAEESRALLLGLYVFLGEVMSLPPSAETPESITAPSETALPPPAPASPGPTAEPDATGREGESK
jgi:hypothetical protein